VIGGVFGVVLLTLPGCLNFGRDDVSATDKEDAEMAKLYRQCLQKNEGNPQKAKANCALYKEAATGKSSKNGTPLPSRER
jgi:hypothetical protein